MNAPSRLLLDPIPASPSGFAGTATSPTEMLPAPQGDVATPLAAQRWARGLCKCCGNEAWPFAYCKPCRASQPKPTIIFDYTSDCQGDYRKDMARAAEEAGLTVSDLMGENT